MSLVRDLGEIDVALPRPVVMESISSPLADQNYLSTLENQVKFDKNCNLYATDLETHSLLVPIQDNMSIEIFFGNITSLQDFYDGLVESGLDVKPNTSAQQGKLSEVKEDETKVGPNSLRKLVLVGHPLKSFVGLNSFLNLSEAWITNSTIKAGKASDFAGLEFLYRLYIYNIGLETLEPIQFLNLRILWVAGNKLQSLSFLGGGIPTLFELNVANNEIVSLQEEHLLKCFNLVTLNLSGNPISTIQDIQAIKVLPSLKDLFLADPIYGKCPIHSQSGSRFTLLTIINTRCNLDGRAPTLDEVNTIQEYVNIRSLSYYTKPIRSIASHAFLQRSAMSLANKRLENIGSRIFNLMSLAARYRRSLITLEITPIFTNAKTLMKEQLAKLEDRVVKLRECASATIKRLETVIQLSHWEQEMMPWLKWIEFQAFGNTICDIIYSVHGKRNGNSSLLCSSMHQILSSLTCPGHWPKNDLLKIESVILFKDAGMESNLNMTHEKHFLWKQEPEFVPPVSDESNTGIPSNALYYQASRHYNLSKNAQKPPETYMSPDYKPCAPLHSFPDSVPGLLEKSQPVYMILMVPSHGGANPFSYLHRIINEKSRNYKDIRLTNCLWIALQNRPIHFTVVIVVKVLFECLQPLAHEKRGAGSMHHQWDCTTFCLKRPLAIAPAYIVNISFTPEDTPSFWQIGKTSTAADDDILLPSRAALSTLTENKARVTSIKTTPRKSPYVRKTSDGVLGDLSCAHLIINAKGEIGFKDARNNRAKTSHLTFPTAGCVENISKVFGPEASQIITSLDLSGNNLTVLVGLTGLNALKKLNLSHNKLQALECLKRLPQLIEFKVGWNSLKNFQNTIHGIREAFPSVISLELLPNPFQDLRGIQHIPIIIRRIFPALQKVDIWKSPFQTSSPLASFLPPKYNSRFDHVAMAKDWIGNAYAYNDLASKCLFNLDNLASLPPFPEGFGANGMDLNLSDNYLDSVALSNSSFVRLAEWRCSIVKLQLQENDLQDLEWMRNKHFPYLQILNLSNTLITELELIPLSCPALKHLQLCGTLLSTDVRKVLFPLRQLDKLCTIDCSGSPLSTVGTEYRNYIMENMKSVQLIDGIPVGHFEIGRKFEEHGGYMKDDWMTKKFCTKSVLPLIDLKAPNCTVQELFLPPQGVSTLKPLTNQLYSNPLTTFKSLASLSSLRVLCLNHNNAGLSTLYPRCFTLTSDSKLNRKSKYPSQEPSWKLGSWTTKIQGDNIEVLNSFQYTPPPTVPSPLESATKGRESKRIVPKLEALIVPAHSLNFLSDLNLTALPQLQEILENSMEMTTVITGHEAPPTIRVILVDNNSISVEPYHSVVVSGGGEYIRYLHMEHNRICAIPRVSQLTSMAALFVGYNRIQNFNDISSLASSGITDLSLLGNSISAGLDYRLRVATQMAQLQKNEHQHHAENSSSSSNFIGRKWSNNINPSSTDPLTSSKWFPAASSMIRNYATNGSTRSRPHITTSTNTTFREFRGLVENKLEILRTNPEFDLRIMSPVIAKRAPRTNNSSGSNKGTNNNMRVYGFP